MFARITSSIFFTASSKFFSIKSLSIARLRASSIASCIRRSYSSSLRFFSAAAATSASSFFRCSSRIYAFLAAAIF